MEEAREKESRGVNQGIQTEKVLLEKQGGREGEWIWRR
jgi:hypothetical protein